MKLTILKKSKRLLSLLLTICMVLTLMPALSIPAYAAPASMVYFHFPGIDPVGLNNTYPYLVNGAQSPTGTLGSGGCTAQHIPATGTLRLHNYNGGRINTSSSGGDLIIDLIGTNTITVSGTSIRSGLYNIGGSISGSGPEPITITSSVGGSLTINVTSTDMLAYGMGLDESPYKNGDLTIKGNAVVTINVTSGPNRRATGLYSEGDISVLENASLSVTAKSIDGKNAMGVHTDGNFNINTTGNVSIDVSGNSSTSYAVFAPGAGKQVRLTKVGVLTLKYTKVSLSSEPIFPATALVYAPGDFTVDKTTPATEIYTYTPGAGTVLNIPEDVTFTARQRGGESDTADSKYIQLSFSKQVPGLTTSNITVTSGTGAVVPSGLLLAAPNGGLSYELELSSVTTEGTVTVSVTSPNAHQTITTPSRIVDVYKLFPLSFTHSTYYDVPDGTVGTDMTLIHLFHGVSGGKPFSAAFPYKFRITSGPAWLSIQSVRGEITGTRPMTPQGFTTAVIEVEDNAGQIASITIDVGRVCAELAFDKLPGFDVPPGLPDAYLSPQINLQPGVSGGIGSYTFSKEGTWPSWLNLNTSSGVLSGIRPASTEAATTVTVRVTDSQGAWEEITLNVGEVNSAFALYFQYDPSFDIPDGDVGTSITPIDLSIAVSGGVAPYVFSDGGGTPVGTITLSAAGLISGNRATYSNYGTPWTIWVTDDIGTPKAIVINVGDTLNPDGAKYNGVDISIPAGETGSPFTNINLLDYIELPAAAASVTYDFTRHDAAWFDYWPSTGMITGVGSSFDVYGSTPWDATTVRFAVKVTYTLGGPPIIDYFSIPVYVGEVYAPLFNVSASDVPTGVPGSAFTTITAAASGGTSPYSYSLVGPSWLDINTSTGVIAATGGSRPMEILPATTALLVVTDSTLSTASVIIQVGAVANPAINLTGAVDIPAGAPGVAITPFTVSASGGTGPFTYSLVGPSWLTINTSTGVIEAIGGTRPLERLAETSALIEAEDSVGDTMNAFINIGAVTLPEMIAMGDYNIPSGAPGDPITDIDLSTFIFGGSSSFTFSKDAGPAWLSVSTAGLISGTRPGAQAADTLTVEVTDTVMGDSIFVLVHVGAVLDASTTYNVTVNSGTADKTVVSEFDVVNIEAAPAAAGFVFDKWVVNSGGAVLSDAGSGNTSFVMPASDVTVTATYKASTGGGGGGGGVISYTVTFNSNGGSSVSSISVASGNKLTKPVDPTKEGFTFAGWYTDAALINAYDFDKNVTVAFTLYAKWTEVVPLPPSSPFDDVTPGHWFYGDVMYVFDNGLMNGTGSGLFSPQANLTRGMIVTILYRLEGEPAVSGANPFDDVAAGQYYTNAVIWAGANEIVGGYGNGNFGPNNNITRQDLAVILLRYMNYKEIVLPVTAQWIIFTDAEDIANYAMDAIQTFNKLGIINGTGTNADGQTIVNPKGNATRAEAAAMLHRFLELIK